MPKMILNRNAAITAGMAYIVFKKDEPQEIHPSHVQACMALGAQACTDKDKEEVKQVFADAPKPAFPTDPYERQLAILDAIALMVSTNIPTDFTSGGAPHAKRIANFTGFEISAAERDEAWARSKEIERENA
jgi:hypothetical protein